MGPPPFGDGKRAPGGHPDEHAAASKGLPVPRQAFLATRLIVVNQTRA